jgi:hypothetical protein
MKIVLERYATNDCNKISINSCIFQLILSEKKCWENHFSDIAADDKRDEEKKFLHTLGFLYFENFFLTSDLGKGSCLLTLMLKIN